jgi:hypothetical protein
MEETMRFVALARSGRFTLAAAGAEMTLLAPGDTAGLPPYVLTAGRGGAVWEVALQRLSMSFTTSNPLKIRIAAAAVLLLLLQVLVIAGDRLPEVGRFSFQIGLASIALALYLLINVTLLGRPTGPTSPAARRAAEPTKPAPETAKPVAPETREERTNAELVNFLAVLQERGRLVDFAMEDATGIPDAQLGAAARVVQQGCRAALKEYFEIRPVREEAEGASISLERGYPSSEYRLVGRSTGEPPYRGTLLHRGWKTAAVKLPRVNLAAGAPLPVIAPAEVELK